MFERYILENGLRVVLVPRRESHSVTAGVFVEVGSRYENKNNNGISHFLEHMCFKGTDNYPRAMDIAMAFDSLGASYNAFTSQERTGYYAKAAKQHVEKIIDLTADIYLNPTLPKEEVERERGVIIEEIRMYEDMPSERVQDIFTNLLYGNSPAGFDVLGTIDNISKISRDDLASFRNKYYLAPATVVVVTGAFDSKKILGKIKEKFKNIKKGEKKEAVRVKENQKEPMAIFKSKDSDQAHLILGVRAISLFDERRETLSLLTTILGKGMSSRLWQKVREELGAAYYVGAGAILSFDSGVLQARAGADKGRLREVVRAIWGEFKKLREEFIDDEELKRAKERALGRLAISLETSDDLMSFYGMPEVARDKIIEPEELIAKINKVNKDDIRELADFLFRSEKLNLAVIGPVKKEDKENIIKELRD